jgi:hypothetical protein
MRSQSESHLGGMQSRTPFKSLGTDSHGPSLCAAFSRVFLLLILIAVTAFAQTTPKVVSSSGYINGTPFTAHTTAAFNSGGASTLVAFVSSHPLWNGQPVSISVLTDNMGNTWNVLSCPSTWSGSSFTLLSAIYYVNAPVTSATHTLTAHLTNSAPLVLQVFPVSGSNLTGPPIYSVITAPITVPANTPLLSWG